MNIYLFKKEFEKTDLGFDYFNLSVMRGFNAHLKDFRVVKISKEIKQKYFGNKFLEHEIWAAIPPKGQRGYSTVVLDRTEHIGLPLIAISNFNNDILNTIDKK